MKGWFNTQPRQHEHRQEAAQQERTPCGFGRSVIFIIRESPPARKQVAAAAYQAHIGAYFQASAERSTLLKEVLAYGHHASIQQLADFFCKEILPGRNRLEAPLIRPASIKVMQRTFNPWNRARYPGGPPAFALRAMAPGQLVCRLVRFQLKQLFMAVRKHTPGGEIASRLAYTQKSRGQNLP